MKNISKSFIIISSVTGVILISFLIIKQIFFPSRFFSDIDYFNDAPDGMYTAVISENKCNYYVHIRPKITGDVLVEIFNNKSHNEEKCFISEYSYGKVGDIIVEWEKNKDVLWIWSGDIGLNMIQKKDGLWEEHFYHDVQNEIDSSSIPQKIKQRAGL